MLAVANAVLSLVDVAVSVTVPAVPGAVNVVATPLAVCVGVKLPQEPEGEQLQSTPRFAESPVTAAVTEAVVPACIVAGGACEIDTETIDVMLMVTLCVAPLFPAAVAVIVTVVRCDGAV